MRREPPRSEGDRRASSMRRPSGGLECRRFLRNRWFRFALLKPYLPATSLQRFRRNSRHSAGPVTAIMLKSRSQAPAWERLSSKLCFAMCEKTSEISKNLGSLVRCRKLCRLMLCRSLGAGRAGVPVPRCYTSFQLRLAALATTARRRLSRAGRPRRFSTTTRSENSLAIHPSRLPITLREFAALIK